MFKTSSLFCFSLNGEVLHIVPINLEGKEDMHEVVIDDRDSLLLLKDMLNEYFDQGCD